MLRRRGAAQHAADPSEQLARLEWFRKVIIGAHLEPENAVERFAACGEHDDWDVRASAQRAAERKPVFAWEREVEDDQIDASGVERLAHRRAVGYGRSRQAVGFEIVGEQRADLTVVVDDQDPGRRLHAPILQYARRFPRVAFAFDAIRSSARLADTLRHKAAPSGHMRDTCRSHTRCIPAQMRWIWSDTTR